jgi:hypothetical protein
MWYIRPSLWLPLKLLLLVWFVWAVAYSTVYGLIYVYSAVRLVFALMPWWGALVSLPFVFAIIGSLSFAIVILYFAQAAMLASVWQSSDSYGRKFGKSVGAVIGCTLVALVLSWLITSGIGWAADHDPCASFKAGVTGGIPPSSSCR